MIDRSDERPKGKTDGSGSDQEDPISEGGDEKDDHVRTGKRSKSREESDTVDERAERHIRDLVEGRDSAGRRGERPPFSDTDPQERERRSEEFDTGKLSGDIGRLESEVSNWNENRREYELAMQRQRNRFEDDLSESVESINSKITRVENWAEETLEETDSYEYDPYRGSFSFKNRRNLGLAGFITAVSEELEETDRRYTYRQEQIMELGREIEDIKEEEIEIEDSRELAAITGLGMESEEVLRYERMAVRHGKKEVYDEIRSHMKKKMEYGETFVDHRDKAEELYDEHASEIELYVNGSLRDLRRTTNVLKRFSELEIPNIRSELRQRSPEVSARMLDDGEQEVRGAYRNAVQTLGVKAAYQYSYLDNAITELEDIEDRMDDGYFRDTERSQDLRQKIQDISEQEPYDQYLEELTEEALEEGYSADHKIRSIFRGIESDLS